MLAAMRPTLRDVITNPKRSIAAILLFAVAVALAVGTFSLDKSHSAVSNTLEPRATATFYGGQCAQGVEGMLGECLEDGKPTYRFLMDEKGEDRIFEPQSSMTQAEAEKLMPEGFRSYLYLNTYLSINDTSAYVSQFPREFHPAGKNAPGPGEILLTQTLARELGVDVGDSVSVDNPYSHSSLTLTVSGITPGHEASVTDGTLVDSSTLPLETHGDLRITGDRPWTWEDTLKLNEAGFIVQSDDLRKNPPAAVDPRFSGDSGQPAEYRSSAFDYFFTALWLSSMAIVLILALAVIAPVFAIAANRQASVYSLMRSQGASKRHIRLAVLAYGIATSIIGGALGLVLGLGVSFTWWKIQFPSWPFSVDVETALISYGVAILGGTAAAAFPAWLAARQPIASGMQQANTGRMTAWRGWMAIGPIALLVIGLGVLALKLYDRDAADAFAILLVLPALIALMASMPAIAYLFGTGRKMSSRIAGRMLRRQSLRSVPAMAAIAGLVFITTIITTASLAEEHHEDSIRARDFAAEFSSINMASEKSSEADVEAAIAAARSEIGPGENYILRTVAADRDAFSSFDLATPVTPAEFDDTYLNDPNPLYLDDVFVDSSFLDLFRLSEEDRALAEQALEQGGMLMSKARGAGLAETTVSHTTLSEHGDDLQVKSVPVAFVLPAYYYSSIASPQVAETFGLETRVSGAVITHDPLGLGVRGKASKAVREAGVDAGFYSSWSFLDDAGLSSYPVPLGVILLVLGLIVALAQPEIRATYTQLSAVGASHEQLRRINASYLGLLALGATLPAYIAATIGVALTRNPALVGESGHVLASSTLATFRPDMLGGLVFVILVPAIAAGIGWLSSPKVGISYRVA